MEGLDELKREFRELKIAMERVEKTLDRLSNAQEYSSISTGVTPIVEGFFCER